MNKYEIETEILKELEVFLPKILHYNIKCNKVEK